MVPHCVVDIDGGTCRVCGAFAAPVVNVHAGEYRIPMCEPCALATVLAVISVTGAACIG